MNYIVSVPVAHVFEKPDFASEHTDELLYGTRVTPDDVKNGFVHYTDEFGYSGWADTEDFLPQGLAPNCMICLPFADLLPEGGNFYAPVMTLPMGSVLYANEPVGDSRYREVTLYDGGRAFIHKSALMPIPTEKTEAEAREAIVKTAEKYLGVQYRWGGKTHNGIDCSGLAFTACRMAGITIWRDAVFEKTPRLREIPASEANKGDLYFFPGHIAVAVGNGDFIHSTASSGRVERASLNPKSPLYHKWYADNLRKTGTLF